MSLWLRKLHTRDLVQPLPRPVVLPERLSTDAIALSGICRASTCTRSTVSPAALQRCWPERFFLTLRAEWSPPCQRITRSSALSSTRTTISSISVRTIRLRVSGATPALDQARSRSAPSVISRRCEINSGRSGQSLQLGLQIAHDRQPVVPSLFQLGGDEAIIGIDGIILAARPPYLVASLLQRQFDLAAFVFVRTAARSPRGECRLDTERLQALGERRRAGNILAHPGWDQGECPVGLYHDQMVLAGEALAVLDLHHLPGPKMERIEDQNLERRTPGIVTLSRPATARAIWRSSRTAGACSSPAPPTSSRSINLTKSLRATINAAIIVLPRHRILILIVARLLSSLSRYTCCSSCRARRQSQIAIGNSDCHCWISDPVSGRRQIHLSN